MQISSVKIKAIKETNYTYILFSCNIRHNCSANFIFKRILLLFRICVFLNKLNNSQDPVLKQDIV